MKTKRKPAVISFVAITKQFQNPKIKLERVFIDPTFIIGLEYINDYTCRLVLSGGHYLIKGTYDCLKKTLQRHKVYIRPVQLKLLEA